MAGRRRRSTLLPLMVEPFWAPSPFKDMEAPEALLSWGEQVERAEREAAAHAAAPVAGPPVSLVSGWGASQSPAGPIDHRPILQDLDMITPVRSARSG